MPIQIGEKPESDFTDPIGMLGDCHRRIVRYVHVLVVLATQRKGGQVSDEQRALLSTSLRYFREAGPKHTADEEESLDIEAVLARIESLEQDHECADRSQVEVDRLGRLWLTAGQLSSDDASRFEELVCQLETLYRHHIGIEDTEVFPCAARVLAAVDRQAIGDEMAVRRGLSDAPVPVTLAESPQ